MKRIIFLLSVLLAAVAAAPHAPAQEEGEGILFDSIPFAEACARAAAANKLIFVDCYVQTCGPCKMMARKVFPQKECGDYFNPRFVSLKQDMDEGDGPALRRRYGVMIYPTFLFIAPDSTLVLKYEAGAEKDAGKFVAKIESALTAADMYKEYSAGRSDAPFIADLMTRLIQFDIRKAREVADATLLDATAEEFADPAIWTVLPKVLNRTDRPAFRRLFDSRQKVGDILGRDTVLATLVKAYSDEFVYRTHDWYDCSERVRDLEILCAEGAPGAEEMRGKILLFAQEKKR